MSLEIFVARHGQNVDNANRILNGHRDLPLTDLGRSQANDLGEGIKEAGINVDRVYSSPLDRAAETARIVCEVLGISVKPEIMPELIERDFGVMTGLSIDEVEERCSPDLLRTDMITYFLNPDGGETFPDVVERGHRVLQKVKSDQTEGSALLVCHGDIGKMIYAAATGQDWVGVLKDFHFGNCDLIDISSNDQAHRIKLPQQNL